MGWTLRGNARGSKWLIFAISRENPSKSLGSAVSDPAAAQLEYAAGTLAFASNDMLWDSLQMPRLLRRALATSRWPPEKMREQQWRRFRRLLLHAYTNVPMYRDLYDRHGFHPRDVRGLHDLSRVPIVDKGLLQSSAAETVVARGVRLDRCRTVCTSGSTGSPLRIYLNAADQRWQRVTAWRILFEQGYRWTDRTMEIRMITGDRHFVQSLGVAPKDWLSLMDPPSSWASHLLATKPEVIVAGASTLAALAKALQDRTLSHPPRLVISDSETLAPPTRELIRRRLGTDPVDVFGLVELSNFAWQCEERRGFHVSADSHIVEIEGACGPMIVTDLGMTGMPMIRYDTGDHAEFDSAVCACGRSLPLLRHIHGRAVDSITLPSGRRLFWPFFHEILGRFPEIRQWRVVANPGHSVRVQLVADATALPAIRHALELTVSEPIALVIEPVQAITWRPGEKQRLVVTEAAP
jgi:phenylacetate-CoA ligase